MAQLLSATSVNQQLQPRPAMASCEVDSCCGCVQLRTGCLIIGYLELVVEIILITLGLVGLVAGATLAGSANRCTLSSDCPELGQITAQTAGGAVMALSVVMLVIVFFLLAFTIVLLVGVHQNKRGHVKAYLIYSYIFLVLSIIGFFAGFAGTIEVEEVIPDLATILLSGYFTLVIRSYYHKMDDKRRQIYNTA